MIFEIHSIFWIKCIMFLFHKLQIDFQYISNNNNDKKIIIMNLRKQCLQYVRDTKIKSEHDLLFLFASGIALKTSSETLMI